MDKEYDLYLVIGSLLISFLTSFLAIAFSSFIVWHKKNNSQWWLIGAALNMGLGIWAMHFVGMLALHLETPVAFEIYRTIASAAVIIVATYLTFWILLHSVHQSERRKKQLGSLILGSGVSIMHYLGMDAMQMFPPIQYDLFLVLASILIAYSASYLGLNLFIKSAHQTQHKLFSSSNLFAAFVISVAVSGMHYMGMAAANFDLDSYCTVVDNGIHLGSLAILVVGLIVALLLISYALLGYEQHIELQEHEHHKLLLQQVSSEVKKRTAELEHQTTMNERLLETMDAIVVVLDNQGRIVQFNFAAQHATGFSDTEIKGRYIWDCLIPLDQVDEVKEAFTELAQGQFPSHHCIDFRTKNAGQITIDWRNSVLMNETGQVDYIIATGVDITQTLKDREALELSAVAFETQEAMVITDSRGIILKVNRAFEEITGYCLAEVLGKNMSIVKSGQHEAEFYKKLWKEVATKGSWQGEIWNRRKGGDVYPEWLRITKLVGEGGKVVNYIGNFSDISQRKKIENELEFLAFYDPVTQLPNRRLFNDRLKQAIKVSHQYHHGIGLMFIDLDNFKHINDTFGHAFGDQLLQAFSQKLQTLLSDDITISRFGGDEFVILLSELQDSMDAASFQCEHLAQIILDALEEGLEVADQKIHISPSMGIVFSFEDDLDAETLMMQADLAMYQAKIAGKNTFKFYTESIGEAMTEAFKMESALRQDLSEGTAFQVEYQPQYNRHKAIVGAEALVRWNSTEYGLVSPLQFIPVAEESGLINELGFLVVKQVLKDIRQMALVFEQTALQHISINLSIKQLTNPRLAAQLVELFEAEQVDPHKVRFEFTESAFLDSSLNPKALFSEMSNIGFTFSLDDFGTGFSSLAYLKELPISELKIDKSFVDGIPNDESDMTICSATISMAQKLGLELVAEGVETQAQFDWLSAQGCDLLQGFLMSKSLKFNDFVALVKS